MNRRLKSPCCVLGNSRTVCPVFLPKLPQSVGLLRDTLTCQNTYPRTHHCLLVDIGVLSRCRTGEEEAELPEACAPFRLRGQMVCDAA